MGFRDRFFTPRTAKAIMSWRLLAGAGAGVVIAVAGLGIGVAIAGGAAFYAITVLAAMPRGRRRPAIDPFVLSEPWRQLVQQAQSSGRRLRATVSDLDEGPLRRQLESIAQQVDRGVDEAWNVARRGDEIDDLVRRLDPTRLRARLAAMEEQAAASPSADTETAIASLRGQLQTADSLKLRSAETADSLRRTQVQLDELVVRAAQVRAGMLDTGAYAHDVDDLVIRLEALHQAVRETGEV